MWHVVNYQFIIITIWPTVSYRMKEPKNYYMGIRSMIFRPCSQYLAGYRVLKWCTNNEKRFILLDDISDKQLCLFWHVTISWFVSLSRSCILLKRQKLSTVSFAYGSPMFLPDCAKFGLHRSTPSSPKFWLIVWPTSFWLERQRHSTANCTW